MVSAVARKDIYWLILPRGKKNEKFLKEKGIEHNTEEYVSVLYEIVSIFIFKLFLFGFSITCKPKLLIQFLSSYIT